MNSTVQVAENQVGARLETYLSTLQSIIGNLRRFIREYNSQKELAHCLLVLIHQTPALVGIAVYPTGGAMVTLCTQADGEAEKSSGLGLLRLDLVAQVFYAAGVGGGVSSLAAYIRRCLDTDGEFILTWK